MKYGLLIAVIIVAAAAIWFGSNKQVKEHARPAVAQRFPLAVPRSFALAGTDSKRDSTVYTLTNNDSVVKIEMLEHVDASDAETLLQDGVMGIQALYANALSPYPGDISNKVTSDPAFQPRLFRVTNAPVSYTYLLLYANDRFGYGATTKDSVKYKSLMGWFYCAARKEFFKVKLFVPSNASDRAMETTLTSLRCR